MDHLNEEVLRLLERGDTVAQHHFAQHLKTVCPVCEDWLQHHSGPFLLDGHADRLLVRALPLGEDDARYGELRRQLRGRSAIATATLTLSGAAACVLMIAALGRAGPLFESPDAESATGLKGHPNEMLELQLARQSPEGKLVRVDVGGSIPASGKLLFRYHATEAGKARLLRQRAREAEPILLVELPLEAGTHDLALNQSVLGVDLTNEAGTTTFILETVPSHGSPARARVSVEIRPTP